MRNWINLFEAPSYTPDSIQRSASFWHDSGAHPNVPVACLPADQYDWSHDPAYPVDKFSGDKDAMIKWMKREIRIWAQEGDEDRFTDLLTDPEIYEPVVATEIDGRAYLWDGNHRVGASHMIGRPTVPAFIGRLKTTMTEGRARVASPELVAWTQRWVESSHKIDDQINSFEPIREEASWFLNVSYPALYRGLSITEEQADAIDSGQEITIAAHRLQSWSKSRGIADDYALPGYGGDIGALVRKPGSQLHVVLDIVSVLRGIGRKSLGTDAAREKEVVVQTDGTLTLRKKDIIRMR